MHYTIKGIDNIGVAVSDMKRAVAFYRQLGFEQGDEYEDGISGCIMTSGTAVLFLFKSEHPNPPPVARQPTLIHNPPGIDHISFLVAEVDHAYAELKAKGVEFSGEPANQ